MKKVLLACLLLAACAKESSVAPASASTFIRYFNGGNNDEAKTVLETPDNGLLILATTQITPEGLGIPYYKIKLIKTDAVGNLVWQKLFPEFANDGSGTVSYKGNGIAANPAGGYVIVGEDIQLVDGSSRVLVVMVDKDGLQTNIKTITTTFEAKGMAASTNSTGNIMILASMPDPVKDNMLLAELDKTTLTTNWTRIYGAGESINLANRLFVDAQDVSYWGGSVKKTDNPTNIRLVKTPVNSLTTVYDHSPSSTSTETINDIVSVGAGTFSMVGKSKGAGSATISLKKFIGTTELFSQSYPFPAQDGDADGNSLATTQDGGIVMLGTSKLTGTAGRGETDYCLVKVDGFGTLQWTKSYGSKYEDVGACIITTSDGGHVVLGTTNLANTKSILLMKTDKNGSIE
jgi:hypothetical protein